MPIRHNKMVDNRGEWQLKSFSIHATACSLSSVINSRVRTLVTLIDFRTLSDVNANDISVGKTGRDRLLLL